MCHYIYSILWPLLIILHLLWKSNTLDDTLYLSNFIYELKQTSFQVQWTRRKDYLVLQDKQVFILKHIYRVPEENVCLATFYSSARMDFAWI